MVNEEQLRLNVTLMLPPELHRAWKVISAIKGIPMRESAVLAIRDWVQKNANIELNLPEEEHAVQTT